ncbi:MAG: hypothetical protein PQJ46_01775 [Spirochaetales bacterium]|nr:hypothetical protein [Spirochaetales bacterium]
MNEFNKIQQFVSQVETYEYDFNIKRHKLEGTRNEFILEVYKFFNEYVLGSVKKSFSAMTAWSYGESEEERMKSIASMCKRKLFAIEEYTDTQYDSVITNENISGNLFVCYMGDYKIGMRQNNYSERWMVNRIDGSYKIVAVEVVDSSSPEGWIEFRQWKSIENWGTRVNTLKLTPPERESDLEHYNSL